MSKYKEYLGDSVYVSIDPWDAGIILTTENGLPNDPSNKIYMEPEVLFKLDKYISQHYKKEEK